MLLYLNCVISFLRLRYDPRPSFQIYLIAWSRLLPEKAIAVPLVKKFLLFYGNRMFIFVFTIAVNNTDE